MKSWFPHDAKWLCLGLEPLMDTLKQGSSVAGSHHELVLYTLGFMYSAEFLQCLESLFHHGCRKRTGGGEGRRDTQKK